MIKIEFCLQGDPHDVLVKMQAKGIVAMMHAIYGDDLFAGTAMATVTHAIGDVSVTRTAPVPPTPPTPVAPAAPTEAATDEDDSGPASTETADVTGLPWDERIHSTPKKQNSDGKWRAKRGVSNALVAQVEAELRAAPAPAAPPAPPAPPVVANDAPPPPAPTPPAPPVAASAPADGEATFVDVMKTWTAKQKDPAFAEYGASILSEFGLQKVTELAGPQHAGIRAAVIAALG